MRVLVLGGTGLVGRLVVEKLVKNDKVKEITLLTRRNIAVDGDKIKLQVVDFTQDYSIEKFDVCIITLGTTRKDAGSAKEFERVDYEIPYTLALKLEKSCHVMLLTSKGSDANSFFLYPKTKGRLEESIKSLQFPKLGIFRPGLLLYEKRNEGRFLEGLMVKMINLWGDGILKRATSCESDRVAQVMVNSLDQKQDIQIYENKDFYAEKA